MSTVTTTILPAARAQRTLIDPGEFRVVFRGVPFQVYKTLLDATPETSAVRLAYDGKDLEIMTVSRLHERSKGFFGRFIEIVTLELSIPCDDAGQTTWVREDAARGLEADESYYLDPAKIQAAVECDNAGVPNIEAYPVPDIGVEIDMSRSGIDRPNIYATLGVPEVWRFDGKTQTVVIEQLGADGAYHPAESSRFLPVQVEEVQRWVVDEKKAFPNMTVWTQRLQEWVRAELLPRHRGAQ